MNRGKALVYMVGEPGSGKSTIMRTVTADLQRVPLPGVKPARDLLLRGGAPVAVELGQRRDHFSGTDALPMTVINEAEPYLDAPEAPLVLGEGARLGNKRFLSAAVAAGYAVSLLHLVNPEAEEWRQERAQRVGKAQNDSWVKGARTRALRLAEEAPQGVEVLTGGYEQTRDRLGRLIQEWS